MNDLVNFALNRMNSGLYLVPDHMHDGLRLYLLKGIATGSFLTAVLSNDLSRAAATADMLNKAALVDGWVPFLHGYLPAMSWGSPENVDAWREAGGIEGRAAAREAAASEAEGTPSS